MISILIMTPEMHGQYNAVNAAIVQPGHMADEHALQELGNILCEVFCREGLSP